MAKKEQARSYMQSYIPQGGKKKYSSKMALFYGLDKRGNADENTFASCKNIDVRSLPYLESCQEPFPADITFTKKAYGEIAGFYAYGESCYVICSDGEKVTLIRIDEGKDGLDTEKGVSITSWDETLKNEGSNDVVKREMSVFCFYDVPPEKIAYEVTPHYYLLVYPDRKYIDVKFKGFEYDNNGNVTVEGDKANVISPVYTYDNFVRQTHKLEFGGDSFNVGLTIEKDGTAQLTATENVLSFLEGCDARVTFTDANNETYACVGITPVEGKVAANDYGLFLQKVTGNNAVLRFVGSAPANDIDTTLYVTDYSSGDIVKSFTVKEEKESPIRKTYDVAGLSPNKKYYAFIDYNLPENSVRYDLYFTLSDKVIGDKLTISGKLSDEKGDDLILDVSRKYTVSYAFADGDKNIYIPDENEFEIQLEKDEGSDSLSPQFQHITVWNSRLFGTRDNVVVCSSAGTPFDWTLDRPEAYLEEYGLTIGGYSESSSWYSTTQANTQASGDIVAITSYDGHPVIFKDDYMHEIYGTKNPFRIQDICAIGCVSARSICELDSVLYFASKDGIYRYSGGYPKRISDSLGDFVCDADTVCGADDGVLYVFNPSFFEEAVYSYNPKTGLWASIENPFAYRASLEEEFPYIIAFASNEKRLYCISDNGNIVYFPKAESGVSSSVKWNITTDIKLFGDAGDKRLHSLKIVAEGYMPKIDVIQNGETSEIMAGHVITKEVEKSAVLLRRFDGEYIKLKLSGEGYSRIHRIDIIYSYSGNRYE